MTRLLRYTIPLFLLVMCAVSAKAQLLDSLALDTLTPYTTLEAALKEPDKVVKLVLRKQKFKTFPVEVLRFKNLQYLDISKNTIKELSDSIDQLQNLQVLICSKTSLERVPKEIGKLTHLRYLNLNQNELEGLPPQIGNLENLEILDLWSNNLSEFPPTLAQLKNLKVLDLRNILMSDATQARIQAMVPHAKVHFSPSCKCSW